MNKYATHSRELWVMFCVFAVSLSLYISHSLIRLIRKSFSSEQELKYNHNSETHTLYTHHIFCVKSELNHKLKFLEHTLTHTSCHDWKNMIGEIPTLWASALHIFWHFIIVGSFPVCVPAGPRLVWGVSEASTTSSHSSFSLHTIVVGRKLCGAPHCFAMRFQSRKSLNHWLKAANIWV